MQRVNVCATATVIDGDDPRVYLAPRVRPGPTIGASILGGSVHELQPGQSVCPFYYEMGIWPDGDAHSLIVPRESAVDDDAL